MLSTIRGTMRVVYCLLLLHILSVTSSLSSSSSSSLLTPYLARIPQGDSRCDKECDGWRCATSFCEWNCDKNTTVHRLGSYEWCVCVPPLLNTSESYQCVERLTGWSTEIYLPHPISPWNDVRIRIDNLLHGHSWIVVDIDPGGHRDSLLMFLWMYEDGRLHTTEHYAGGATSFGIPIGTNQRVLYRLYAVTATTGSVRLAQGLVKRRTDGSYHLAVNESSLYAQMNELCASRTRCVLFSSSPLDSIKLPYIWAVAVVAMFAIILACRFIWQLSHPNPNVSELLLLTTVILITQLNAQMDTSSAVLILALFVIITSTILVKRFFTDYYKRDKKYMRVPTERFYEFISIASLGSIGLVFAVIASLPQTQVATLTGCQQK